MGLHNSNLSHILSCLFIGSGDISQSQTQQTNIIITFCNENNVLFIKIY
ncbi:hypothetical protein [uncultured Gammaproteobacteria bacterium]|nr:hypothetical protein [uncultured Gammaproteobacteria bacterium]CAC9962093.1 hypothetical protein [uncultured Gammaproteobacteria bacterium]